MKHLYRLAAALTILGLVYLGLKTNMNNTLAFEKAAARTLELDQVQCAIANKAHVERQYVQVWELCASSSGFQPSRVRVR